MGIVDDVLAITDEILGIRDDIGAIKETISILTRTWDEEKGKGDYTDTIEQILPTPWLIDYAHRLDLKEGGNIRQGDILIKMISMESYATEDLIDCSVTDEDLTEKYYLIKDRLYEVVSVTQEYVYWNVLVRKTIKTYVPQGD
jgi:hypothetical protein